MRSSRLWIHPAHEAIGDALAEGFAAAWNDLQGETIDSNRLRRVERLTTASGPRFLKRFLGVQPKNAIKLRLQAPRCRSQAEREVRVIEALARHGFRVPEVLAWGDECGTWRERRSLLLLAPLAGQPISELTAPERDLVLRVAHELGRAIICGVFLPDLGLDHVFEPGPPETGFGLIDFHNARFWPAPGRRELGRAVVRFFRSPGGTRLVQRGLVEDFARTYLQGAGRPEALAITLRLCRERLP
jgi:hypothetical protein